ncbi:hypothetical protein BpHYR1_040076 [Brachionus plicatilis]|uniref:Uncharacterized protein n=1 Tax=Brachionus plicatilis TaxID=10195 RepID=A0A3M7RDR1_BRAPC|nr:hypothetical protein BpHYR1_040076 [Brachionus plicatilis]
MENEYFLSSIERISMQRKPHTTRNFESYINCNLYWQYKLKLTCTHFVLRPILNSSSTLAQIFLNFSSIFPFPTFVLGRVEEKKESRKGRGRVEERKCKI